MTAALQSYSTGTVSVTQGSDLIELAGDGAAWLESWAVPGNQVVIAGEAQANYAVEWIDATHVRLALPVARATTAGLTYSILITAAAFGTNRLGALTAVERIRLMTENEEIAQLLGIADAAAVAPALNDLWALWDMSDGGNVKAGTAASLLRLASSISTKAADYAVSTDLVTSDYGKLIVMSAAVAARTVTLPTAATAGAGFVVGIKKSDASDNGVTIDGGGAEKVDGALTLVLTKQNDVVWLRCDGAAWQVASQGGGNVAALAALAKIANLVAFAGLAGAANKVPRFTADAALDLKTVTDFFWTLADDNDAATALATLGLSANGRSLVTAASYADMRLLLSAQGYRGELGNTEDLDTVTTDGYWNQSQNADISLANHYPVLEAGMLTVKQGIPGSSASWIYQTYHTYTDRIFRRVKYAGAWYGWHEVYTQKNAVGTVSATAGVPTGAIIERGSNSNGEYVRFADGTQICWVKLNAVFGNVAFCDTGAQSWPAAFATVSSLMVAQSTGTPAPAGVSGAGIAYTRTDPSSTNIRMYVYSAAGVNFTSSATIEVRAIGIGRWF